MSKTLYETDYLKWIETTVAQLRMGDYSQNRESNMSKAYPSNLTRNQNR